MAPPNGSKINTMSLSDRKSIFSILWSSVDEMGVRQLSFSSVRKNFPFGRTAIFNLWKRTLGKMRSHLITEIQNESAEDQPAEQIVTDAYLFSRPLSSFPESVFANNKTNCGAKRTFCRAMVREVGKDVALNRRSTYRGLAAELSKSLDMEISHQTVWKLLKKESVFRIHRSSLKPTLTEANKLARLTYAIEEIDDTTGNSGARTDTVKYRDQMDRVHVDEKWFFLCYNGRKYILVSDEEDPYRHVKHKSHITKVMFLCAQARPRHVAATNSHWDGKIGIWPVGEWIPAKRSSVNRPAGTLVWENHTVDNTKYREILLDNVLPAILAKWPAAELERPGFRIGIQQDGAKAHIHPQEEHWLYALDMCGVLGKIYLYTQPANSPDTNLNDLGFFAALQAQYRKEAPRNAGEIIAMVEQAYDDFPSYKINRIWLSYMQCLNEIIVSNGENDYKLGHMGKAQLERESKLPRTLEVHPAADEWLEDE
jgi:hypothetical protein